MAYSTKIYIVQKVSGEVIGAKTAFAPAHALAKAQAPARVLFAIADKTSTENVVGYNTNHSNCNQLQS